MLLRQDAKPLATARGRRRRLARPLLVSARPQGFTRFGHTLIGARLARDCKCDVRRWGRRVASLGVAWRQSGQLGHGMARLMAIDIDDRRGAEEAQSRL